MRVRDKEGSILPKTKANLTLETFSRQTGDLTSSAYKIKQKVVVMGGRWVVHF